MSAPESIIKVHVELDSPTCAFTKFVADGFIVYNVEADLKN